MFRNQHMSFRCREEQEELDKAMLETLPDCFQVCENCCGRCIDRYVDCFWMIFSCFCMCKCPKKSDYRKVSQEEREDESFNLNT